MIEYKVGNVFANKERTIVHGCNCFNSMGAGIAAQIAKQYPQAMLVDTLTQRGDKGKLGTYTSWTGTDIYHPQNEVTIVNAYTQYKYTRDEVDVDYDAFAVVMHQILMDFSGDIAMPKIGAGLAGGDWTILENFLEQISDPYGRTFRVYTLT